MNKRSKRAEALALVTSLTVDCPYKACGHQINYGTPLDRGDIITCGNCRKSIHITKIDVKYNL